MCNLYSQTTAAEAMRRLFKANADRLGNAPPLPGIFPRMEAPVVRRTPDGQREIVPMHWGFLVPQVSKKTGKPILPKAFNNARDDSLLSTSLWRESAELRRCLLPATAFCEPKGRQPATYHWFGVLGDDGRPGPFAFAGIWRRWRGRYRDGEFADIETSSMVTSTPNELVREVHPDRMPVILPEADWESWLTAPVAEAMTLLRPFPAERMTILASGLDLLEEPGAIPG